MTLGRYRSVIADWDAFARVARTPEPTALRLRRRDGASSVSRELRRQGFELDPVDGLEGFFRVSREPFPVSKTLEHWLGDYYIQQAVTGVAALALGARPGERVLDLCAAPGGKTTHLADRMDDSGILVASDPDTNRIRALLANVYRLSHPNVLVVETDGRSFPGGARFDRVLVDVPCSAEGNVRRHGGEIRSRSASFTAHITGIQKALLKRALEVARPGGIVLYVTCTFAPEENEAVVDDVLRDTPCELEPIDLDLPHAPGLTGFEGRSYRDDLRRAWRIYPHHLDSGGLFLARIRRPPDDDPGQPPESADRAHPGAGWSPVPAAFPGPKEGPRDGRDIGGGVASLEATFGLETLRGVRWMERGDSIWSHRCARWPVESWDPSEEWRVISLGVRAMKRDPRTAAGQRPTSDFLRMMGDRVERRVVDLEEGELLELLDRRSLETPGVDRGFVALGFRGRILGRGWVKGGVLRNEISKARSRRLLADLGGRIRMGERND